jgi:hypothetical protein
MIDWGCGHSVAHSPFFDLIVLHARALLQEGQVFDDDGMDKAPYSWPFDLALFGPAWLRRAAPFFKRAFQARGRGQEACRTGS